MVSGVAVAAGLQPASTRPGWRRLKHPDGYATSFWVSPQDITSETLDRLWLPDTDATVVTIRLTAVADGRTEVSAWVHYHSGERLGKDVSAGLNLLTGRQLAAVHTDRGGSLLVGADLGIGPPRRRAEPALIEHAASTQHGRGRSTLSDGAGRSSCSPVSDARWG
jgi:hypothetical protein